MVRSGGVPPRWQGPTSFFELRSSNGFIQASVPHSPGLLWRLTRDGEIWFVHTGSYELFKLSATGDTVRQVTQPFRLLPVTSEEKDSAVAGMRWFVSQGGTVDRGRIPDVKVPVQSFQVAEDGYLWVEATQADTALIRRAFDIFDPDGRFLGTLRLPFYLSAYPMPLLRGNRLIGVTQDDDGVPYIVRARIERN